MQLYVPLAPRETEVVYTWNIFRAEPGLSMGLWVYISKSGADSALGPRSARVTAFTLATVNPGRARVCAFTLVRRRGPAGTRPYFSSAVPQSRVELGFRPLSHVYSAHYYSRGCLNSAVSYTLSQISYTFHCLLRSLID